MKSLSALFSPGSQRSSPPAGLQPLPAQAVDRPCARPLTGDEQAILDCSRAHLDKCSISSVVSANRDPLRFAAKLAAEFPDPAHEDLHKAVSEIVTTAHHLIRDLVALQESDLELFQCLSPCAHLIADEPESRPFTVVALTRLIECCAPLSLKGGELAPVEASIRLLARLLALRPAECDAWRHTATQLVAWAAEREPRELLGPQGGSMLRACELLIDAIQDVRLKTDLLERLVRHHTQAIKAGGDHFRDHLLPKHYAPANRLSGKCIQLGAYTTAPALVHEAVKSYASARFRSLRYLAHFVDRPPHGIDPREMLQDIAPHALASSMDHLGRMELCVALARASVHHADMHTAGAMTEALLTSFTIASQSWDLFAALRSVRDLLPPGPLRERCASKMASVCHGLASTERDLEASLRVVERALAEDGEDAQSAMHALCACTLRKDWPFSSALLDRAAALSFVADPSARVEFRGDTVTFAYPAEIQARREVLHASWGVPRMQEAAGVIIHLTPLLPPLAWESSTFRGPQPQLSDLPQLMAILDERPHE